MSSRKIEPKDGLEIFVNAYCNITLKQVSSLGEEALIVVDRSDVPTLIKYLQELYDESADCVPETEDEAES